MIIRDYISTKDNQDLIRIWQEIGWITTEKDEEEGLTIFVQGSKSLVAEIDQEVEGFVCSTPARLQYLNEPLELQAITAVTVSRVARKQGIAGSITARAIAEAAGEGYQLSGLGMFEQGFYNQLGFGTGSYEHIISFDPASLNIEVKARPPKRISAADWEKMHRSRLNRCKKHGYCTLLPAAITRAELKWTGKKGFGLGYFQEDGELSHYFWCKPDSVEHGPYFISVLVYNNAEQLLELISLLKSLGDQVNLIKMKEPAGIQLQDLINQPFRGMRISKSSKYESVNQAVAYWQVRILDLPGAISHTQIGGNPISFNLELRDPIEKFLPAASKWRGLSGSYIITFGQESTVEIGSNRNLPTLKASVGAFTRLWLGVQPASGLAATDQLTGPVQLLTKLDHQLCLPKPLIDWDF